jgi:hypothetical protein
MGCSRDWPLRPSQATAKSARGVTPPSELDHQQATAITLQRCGASHEVWSPTAHSSRAGLLSSSLPDSIRSAFRVSHPLDGFLPDSAGRLFFKSEALMGLSPSELFPPDEADAPLDARGPPDVGHPTVRCRCVDRRSSWSAATRQKVLPRPRQRAGRRLASRVSHLAGVRCQPIRVFAGRRPVALLGFVPLQGFTPLVPGTRRLSPALLP